MFTKMFPKRGADGLTNRERSNNSEYNRKVYCKYCDYHVRQGGHESRCRRNGPSRQERRAAATIERVPTEHKRAFKKFISNQAVIKQEVLDNYMLHGSCGEKERTNLYAFVLPMGCGKTTISNRHGFIDIDSCGTSLSERDGIANCVMEMVSKRDWCEAMKAFANEVDSHLDAMTFMQKTLILVHDATMATYIGAEIIGGCTLTDDALSDACVGRTKVQRGFADINNSVVRASTEKFTELSSVSLVESTVIEACCAAGIASGAPGNGPFGAPGYLTKNDKILNGMETNLEALSGLYSKFKVPAESVYYAMQATGVLEYQGFGGTSDRLAKILSTKQVSVVKLVDRWEELATLLDMGKDPVVGKMVEKFSDDKGYLTRIVSHWLSVGMYAENPEVFFRLYSVGRARWNTVFRLLTNYLNKSRFWFGKKLKTSECEKILDMRHLLSVKGQQLCTETRKVHGPIVTSAELQTMVEMTEVSEPLEFDREKFELTRSKCAGDDKVQMDYMTSNIDTVSTDTLRNMEIPQMVCCILMANHPPEAEKTGIWRATRCDSSDAGNEWEDVLAKANKMSSDAKLKVATVLATLLHSRVNVDLDGSLTDFLKYMQEYITNGKVCQTSSSEYGQPANVHVCGGDQPYCTTTIEDDKWQIIAKDVNLDWSNVLWISSQQRASIEKMRAMRVMSRSVCLSIRDLVEAGLDQKEYVAQCCHLIENCETEGSCVVMNAFGKRMYHMDEYNNMRKVMFTSTKDRGMGFRLPKGQVYRSSEPAQYTEKNGIRMPSTKKFKAEKKKQEGTEQTLLNDIDWDGGSVDTPVSVKTIAEVGLSCGVYLVETCGNHEKMRKIVRW